MNTAPVLVFGLYAEGVTDTKFLPLLLQRTIQRIVDQQGRFQWDVWPIQVLNNVINPQSMSYAQRILQVAEFAEDYHALIIHRDADKNNPKATRKRRFEPVEKVVRQAKESGQKLCANLVPLIPVREMEAWMLADAEALRDVLQMKASVESLGLPNRVHEIEAIRDPKQKLNQIIESARTGFQVDDIYEPLARRIRLEQLKLLPSYQTFLDEMMQVLRALEIIA